MFKLSYFQKVVITILGALIAIPSVATGFYIAYRTVTLIGN